MNVSFYKNLLGSENTTISINKFVDLIKNGLYKEQIIKIREAKDKDEQNKLKKLLPAITTSGIFGEKRKESFFVTYSDLICVDIDNLNILELKEKKQLICNDKSTYICFISPSGNGLKVFFKVKGGKEKHLINFLALKNYFLDKFNISIDEKCKDITRLCFLSYDKDIYYNENNFYFEIPKINQLKENTNTSHKTSFVNIDDENRVLTTIESIKKNRTDITGDYNDWLKIGFSFADFFGERGRGYFQDVSQFYTGYDYENTDKQYTTCLKNSTGKTKINTFFHYAKENNIEISKNYIQVENKEAKKIKQVEEENNEATVKATEKKKTKEKANEATTEVAEKKIKNQKKIIKLKEKYVRVATNYFKKIMQKDKYQIENISLEKWTKQTIIDDFKTSNFLHPYKFVPKYDTFVNAPNNINYKQVINNCYNLYERITHPIKQGQCLKTIDFLQHIFQDKFDVGLDYITLLYQKPTQILPILCLVSEERKTGKSTFLKYLRYLFQSNCIILSNENFASDFNSFYASKLLICIDETFVSSEKKQQSERIKKMATDDKIMIFFKGVDGKEIDFYGKLIMCSNNEKNFVHIDKEENRFFINKVPILKKENPNLLDDLIAEIPAFLNFIATRQTTYQKETRHFFNDELIQTKTLNEVKNQSYNQKEKEIINTIIECFEFSENNILYYSATQLHEFIKKSNTHIQRQDIKDFLKNKMKLKTEPNKRYEFFDLLKAQATEDYKICDSKTGTPYKLEYHIFKELE